MRLFETFALVMISLTLLKAQPGGELVPKTDAKLDAMPGFDVSAMDPLADPCDDFYRYACGTWIANNPIPSDRSRWGRFDELAERNLSVLRSILEKTPPQQNLWGDSGSGSRPKL